MAQDSNNWQQQVWQQPPDQQMNAQPQMYAGAPAGGYGQPPCAPVPPTPPKPQRSHGWIVALVAVILLFVLLFAGVMSCSSAVSSLGSLGTSSETDMALLADDSIGVIEIDSTIQYDGTNCSPEGLKAQLDKAADSKIKAVVLRVDSGGGVATAGEEMSTYVKEFREKTGKPVVVSSASSNCSAAYEISSQADYIFVGKSTSIGAIGTAMQITDLSGLYDMLGINIQDVISSGSKDSTYGTRPLTDEEKEYYQAMVDQINEGFIENVAEGRNMSTDEVRELATGLTFTGLDAIENGLADEVGTKEDAVEKAAQLAGLSTYTTVNLQSESSSLSALLSLLSESEISVDQLVDALEELEADGSFEQ